VKSQTGQSLVKGAEFAATRGSLRCVRWFSVTSDGLNDFSKILHDPPPGVVVAQFDLCQT